jgi:hypothetical protein
MGRSGNVIENKGSYASKAGILLKRKVVSCRQVVGGMRYVVGGRWYVVGGASRSLNRQLDAPRPTTECAGGRKRNHAGEFNFRT